MANFKCKNCGETDDSNFYYGKKNICKECLKNKNKEKYIKKETLVEKFDSLIDEVGKLREENESFKKGFEELSKEIDILKGENISLKEKLNELSFIRGRSPKPISRSPSPKKISRSPKAKSRSPSPKRNIPLPLPINSLVKVNCNELLQMETKAKFANIKELKPMAQKLNISLSVNGKVKPVDTLRKDVISEIKKRQDS